MNATKQDALKAMDFVKFVLMSLWLACWLGAFFFGAMAMKMLMERMGL